MACIFIAVACNGQVQCRYGANALDMCHSVSLDMALTRSICFVNKTRYYYRCRYFLWRYFFCSTFVMALCPTALYLAMNSKKVGFLLFFGIFLHFVLNCVLIYARIYSNLVTLCIPYTFALCYTILLQFLH